MISLGIDIGGTGCKCVAFRDNGEQVALSYREYPTKPGEVNLDALALRESVFFVISDCVRKLEDPKDVTAITVSSFGESFVPVDKDGQPLTDIILYFANTESGAFTDLVNSIGAEKFMRITCVLPDASYSLAKMLYSLKAAPRPVWKFLFIASYICFCLSGESVADYSLACRSILFDVRKLCWSDELTSACGIDPAKTHIFIQSMVPSCRPARAPGRCCPRSPRSWGCRRASRSSLARMTRSSTRSAAASPRPATRSISPARSSASARCSPPSPRRWTLSVRTTPASRISTARATSPTPTTFPAAPSCAGTAIRSPSTSRKRQSSAAARSTIS